MKMLYLVIGLICFCYSGICVATDKVANKNAASNTIALEVDNLLNAHGKVNWVPMVELIVSYGDQAVPILTNRLVLGNDDGRFQFCLVSALCKIDTDASLKPIRGLLQDSSLDQEIITNRMSREHGIFNRYQELETAIREYPKNREMEILPQLIHYSDFSFSILSFWSCDRLRVMIHRHPAVVGAMIASLDDKRDQFSYNLGDILNRELGNPFRWPPGSVSDTPQNAAARYNSFWRDWWQQNKDNYKGETMTNSALQTIR